MADTPELAKPASKLPYLAAAMIFTLMAVVLVLGVVYLRPQIDILILIGAVVGFMGTIGTAAMAFLKAQETHMTVNSQLTAWKKEYYGMAHAQGEIAGAQTEQERVAEQKRITELSSKDRREPAGVGPAGPAGPAGAAGATAPVAPASVAAPAAPAGAPTEVVVTNPLPIKVKETPHEEKKAGT